MRQAVTARTLIRCALVAVMVASSIAAMALVPTDTAKVGADRWAAALNSSDRSSFLAPGRFARLPFEYRRAVLVRSTAEEQVAVWRRVFADFREARHLSADDLAAVNAVESALRPEIFLGRERNVSEARMLKSVDLIRARFGESAVKELFYTAGPAGRGEVPLPILERVSHSWRRSQPALAFSLLNFVSPTLNAKFGRCECNDAFEDCFLSACDMQMGDVCEWWNWSCGPWFAYQCNGMCRVITN